jgi:hypothetical protein
VPSKSCLSISVSMAQVTLTSHEAYRSMVRTARTASLQVLPGSLASGDRQIQTERGHSWPAS